VHDFSCFHVSNLHFNFVQVFQIYPVCQTYLPEESHHDYSSEKYHAKMNN